ncbi:MAG: TIGR04133 family radical SAM/SPASM protein [Rikenellaceae bacterium]|nr:TIGR04133 family radical SAM/SPASM protein [Rikenellaceae bacterium]
MSNDLNGRRLGLRKRLGLELFAQLYKRNVEEHPLRTLFWECTLRCNLNCRHCGSDCRAEATVPDMPLEDFLRVVDEQITPHVDPHKVMVVISGGEVLVRKDLERAGLELYRRGYPWGIVTNALVLTPERFESLLRAGLHSISVSFDGFEEQHNYIRRNPHSYERALAALRMIATDGTVAYDAVTCVTGSLVPRLEEMKELLIANGIKHWRIFTIFPVGRAADDPTLRLSDEQFREVMEFIRRTRREGRIELTYACEGFLGGYETEVRDTFYYCSAGVTTASIRVDGALSGCTSIRSNFDQGNIYHDNFWEVWSKRYEPFRNREWARRDECGDCKMFRYCLGGGMHLRDDEGKLLMCHYKRL